MEESSSGPGLLLSSYKGVKRQLLMRVLRLLALEKGEANVSTTKGATTEDATGLRK